MEGNQTYTIGVGLDLCDVERIEKLLEKHGDTFLKKTFTKTEIEFCKKHKNPAPHYAARFAAKEAMAKALGTGFRDKITLLSLSVENDELGAPHAVLDKDAAQLAEKLGAKKMLISLTHLKDYAQAVAILTK